MGSLFKMISLDQQDFGTHYGQNARCIVGGGGLLSPGSGFRDEWSWELSTPRPNNPVGQEDSSSNSSNTHQPSDVGAEEINSARSLSPENYRWKRVPFFSRKEMPVYIIYIYPQMQEKINYDPFLKEDALSLSS